MEKITKGQIAKKVRESKEDLVSITVCPSKVSPESMFAHTIKVDKDLNVVGDSEKTPLTTYINSFSYYNCSNELGNSIHYYI